MKSYTKQYIDGLWREGTGSAELSNVNPYTNEVIYTYRSAGEKDIDDAYAAAAAAQTEWAETPPGAKQALMEKLLTAIAGMKDEIYACLIEEGGSTIPKADFEFFTSMDIVKQAMSFPLMLKGKILPSNIPGKENYIYKSPRGVISVITPWNVPLVLAMRSVIPAIATGNTVVLKPSTDTPGSAFLIANMFEKAGFPKGVLNVVAGRGSEIGDSFAAHPIPELISFTGSTEVGRHIGEIAGKQLKDVSLELGGNNAMIVLPDADLEKAVQAAVFGAYFHQGQVCMALNRIIVDELVHDDFVKLLTAAVQKLKVGNPAAPDTFIGLIINKSQIEHIEKLVEATIQTGAVVELEGRTEGNLVYPWVLSGVDNCMPGACIEVFGPVVCVIKAKSEKEAIRIANDSEYGLSGSVFTSDLYHGIQVAKQLKTGMVHVNDQSINDEPHVMFGGEKASGIGRFNAEWVVDKFTSEQWLSVQREYRPF